MSFILAYVQQSARGEHVDAGEDEWGDSVEGGAEGVTAAAKQPSRSAMFASLSLLWADG